MKTIRLKRMGEDEYRTNETLPKFAKEELEKRYIHCTFVLADEKGDKHNFAEMSKLKDADLRTDQTPPSG